MILLLASILTPLWLIGTIPVWRAFRRDTPAVGLWPMTLELLAALCWPIWVAAAGAIAAIFAYVEVVRDRDEYSV